MRLARRAAALKPVFPSAHVPAELDPGIIAFDSGFAFPHLLPDLTPFATKALTAHREEALQYAAGQGHTELRAWIARYMNDDGCAISPQNVLIVHGAKNGLDLICRLLLDEGDSIVVSAPMYFTAIPIFRNFGAELIAAGQSAEGLDIEALERTLETRARAGCTAPKFIYNVADFHNPSGLTMSRARREALVELATRRGIYIVEDNPYRRVRFEGQSIPTLKALDRTGNTVLHVGTFSKLIAPGLRIGWIAAQADLIARLIQLKSDGGENPLIQRIVLDFCSSPAFEAHARQVQATYREHRDRMVAAIQRELPGVTLTIPEGGYYLWVTLPPHIDGEIFAQRAEEAAVHIIAGARFFSGSDEQTRAQARNHVRLSYSFATPAQIDAGLSRLGTIYRAFEAT
jgi:2-aminoadipate transaminase